MQLLRSYATVHDIVRPKVCGFGARGRLDGCADLGLSEDMNRRRLLGIGLFGTLGLMCPRWALAQQADPVEALTDCIDHHRKFRACFATKFRTGYCDFTGFDGKRTSRQALLRMLDVGRARLIQLSYNRPTAALLYHVRDDGLTDIFLMDGTGVIGWERSQGDLTQLLDGLRVTLDVDTRAAMRGATPLGRKKVEEPPQAPATDMTAVSRHLLPGSIGVGILAGRYERLLVLASGAVSQAPLPALLLPNGKTLLDRASVVLLADPEALFLNEDSFPDLSMAVEALTFDTRSAISGMKLLVGNPEFGDVEGWALPPLPGAEAEIRSVATEFASGETLIGKAASRKAIMATLNAMQEKGGVAYFATHGVSDPVNPMDGSFLALAGDVLRGQQIRKLRMVYKHPLVVMSACQSGLGKTFGGGGYGLARAWYEAGAGQVVGSLWNVSDEGTNYLMTRFARALVRGRENVEDALRIAMQQTRDNFSADPAIWASFVSFGNPGI